ncbi:MAG: hypothetical protein ACK528_06615, partial [Alphaproteobacteria bacterium]
MNERSSSLVPVTFTNSPNPVRPNLIETVHNLAKQRLQFRQFNGSFLKARKNPQMFRLNCCERFPIRFLRLRSFLTFPMPERTAPTTATFRQLVTTRNCTTNFVYVPVQRMDCSPQFRPLFPNVHNKPDENFCSVQGTRILLDGELGSRDKMEQFIERHSKH